MVVGRSEHSNITWTNPCIDKKSPSESRESKIVQTELDSDTYERLKQLAEQEETSLKDLTRSAIVEYVRRHLRHAPDDPLFTATPGTGSRRAYEILEDTETVVAIEQELDALADEYEGNRREHILEARGDAEYFGRSTDDVVSVLHRLAERAVDR